MPKIERQYIFNIFAVMVISIITVLFLQAATAFSIREFLGLEQPKSEEKTKPGTDARPKIPNKAAITTEPANEQTYDLDYDELQKIVSVIDDNQRKVILGDEKAFNNFVKNEATNKSILSAAHANKIDQNDRNRFIVRRGAENIIREIYLRQLIATKIPAEFPGEERMKQFYENNKERFTLEERVQVWQIFLPKAETADKKEIELLKKQAEAIITDINKGKMDFLTAANKYSNPQAGKYNGGYMGLVQVNELKPEIKQPLMALAPDKLTAPIDSENGIHILKRGHVLSKQVLGYDEVKDRIAETLNKQLQNQLRRAVYKQAAETYPVDINDNKIEEWRLKLRTQMPGQKTGDEESQGSG